MFKMLCGISGSGKSTYANGKDFVVHSSDKLRKELYGDEGFQGDNNELFEILHKNIIEDLKRGENVIYDATNLNSRRRTHFLNMIKNIDCEKEIIVFNTDIDECKKRDYLRERTVGESVIEKQIKAFNMPNYYEGWDNIVIVNNNENICCDIDIHSISLEEYQDLCVLFDLDNIIGSPQNSSYHTLSIDRHNYKVYLNLKKYKDEDLLWSALLHDIGKDFTRKTNSDTLYDSFYGHENVSSYLAVNILYKLGMDLEDILKIVGIIQNHMKMMNSNLEKLKKRVGDDLYKKLEIFYEADKLGK